MGVQVFVNPDGHEWKRGKWNALIKRYWKLSERLMVKHADLLICDSKGIEQYIQHDYAKYTPKTTYIAYGADLKKSSLEDHQDIFVNWKSQFEIQSHQYYLMIGRFVPENNYELIIKEFMKSTTRKQLIIITGIEKNAFYQELLEKTRFDQDPRIQFVGTVYNQQLLKKIREQAYGYLHGHEVGGTNPSLLEALASTKLNLLYDVIFNREVAEESAIYFTRVEGSLSSLLDAADQLTIEQVESYGDAAKERINLHFSWDTIVHQYEELFITEKAISVENDITLVHVNS
jgi:rhamnosyltransferase